MDCTTIIILLLLPMQVKEAVLKAGWYNAAHGLACESYASATNEDEDEELTEHLRSPLEVCCSLSLSCSQCCCNLTSKSSLVRVLLHRLIYYKRFMMHQGQNKSCGARTKVPDTTMSYKWWIAKSKVYDIPRANRRHVASNACQDMATSPN